MAKTSGNQKTIYFLAIALVVLAAFSIFYGGQQTAVDVPAPSGDTGQIPVTTCDSTTSPQLDIRTYDIDNPGTFLTEATNLYRIKGNVGWQAFTADTAFAIDAGEELEIIMGISTTDFTDNAYGQHIESYIVPCKETPTVSYAVANDEVETSLSATFYNGDDNAEAETFTAGVSQTVEIQLQAGADEYFGNPFYQMDNPNVLALELNSTEWDRPERVNVKGGNELSSIDCPQRVLTDNNAAGVVFYCYELPVIDENELRIELRINPDDSNAPSVDGTAYMYAGNYFINTETTDLEFGIQNEEFAAVGTDAADSLTLDFTA